VFTISHNRTLSWAISIHFKSLDISLSYILTLSFHLHLCLPRCPFSSFPNKNFVSISCFPYACYNVRVFICLCSLSQRLRCQRKEPCRLFTVRKRQELLDEVNTNTLCQCPHGHTCPRRHTDAGVIVGKSYTEEAIKTYSGYCISWTGVTTKFPEWFYCKHTTERGQLRSTPTEQLRSYHYWKHLWNCCETAFSVAVTFSFLDVFNILES
jgi:hypothetical protein